MDYPELWEFIRPLQKLQPVRISFSVDLPPSGHACSGTAAKLGQLLKKRKDQPSGDLDCFVGME